VLNIALGLVLGLIVGVGVAMLREVLDNTVKGPSDFEGFGVPVLGNVPLDKRTPKTPVAFRGDPHSSRSEAYRQIRTNLQFVDVDNPPRIIAVTSAIPGEGKSTTAINLAHSLVQAGNRVILIEADMHRPSIGPALGVRPRHGIASVLIRQVRLEDALTSTEAYGPDLQLLLVERPGLDSADRLSLPTAKTLISEAEALADFVVVDAPPLTEVIDALPLAQQVSDVLVVVRLGRSKLRKVVDLGEILSQHDIQPAGVALVGVERSREGGYYYTGRDAEPDPQPVDA
jgi:receptor protein-tyrosine kinase